MTDTDDLINIPPFLKRQVPHEWVPSTLGHGETMCKHCLGTNRELAAIGQLNHCDKAPEQE